MALPELKQLVDDAKAQIREIGSPELRRMMGAKEEFSLIEIREPDECAGGTIQGAATVARGILERDIDKVTTNKGRPIVLY